MPEHLTEVIQDRGEAILAMKRNGNACGAHDEKTGGCSIYKHRPSVCRIVQAGSNSCGISKSLMSQRAERAQV